jgi:GDP-D-mannose dehydratase
MISSDVIVPRCGQVPGATREYVEAMWLMLQQHRPNGSIISTGETRHGAHVVRHCPRSRGARLNGERR